MKKALSIAVALAFVAALALPALAGDSGQKVELAGWITDEWCGEKNANADGAGCAKACAKKGAELVLFSEGTVYKLSDQKNALEHVGHKVIVKGVLKGENTVEVNSIQASDADS